MAYNITCDKCGGEIESGKGRPVGQGRGNIYCGDCSEVVKDVESEVRKYATRRAMELASETNEYRTRLLKEHTPARDGEKRGEQTMSYPAIREAVIG